MKKRIPTCPECHSRYVTHEDMPKGWWQCVECGLGFDRPKWREEEIAAPDEPLTEPWWPAEEASRERNENERGPK